jgi:hypothetical protein
MHGKYTAYAQDRGVHQRCRDMLVPRNSQFWTVFVALALGHIFRTDEERQTPRLHHCSAHSNVHRESVLVAPLLKIQDKKRRTVFLVIPSPSSAMLWYIQ